MAPRGRRRRHRRPLVALVVLGMVLLDQTAATARAATPSTVSGTASGTVSGTASGTATQPARPPAQGSDALLLLVDFSGSMNEPDGSGATRIEAAKRAVAEIATRLPARLPVGVRVYGHRVPSAQKERACQDTELVVPVAPLDADRIVSTVNSLTALGETPIGLSLREAAADVPDGSAGTIILVSDGADECYPDLGPDPCQVVRELVATGVDIRLETIGLQVEPAGRQQLECMAAAGGGEFTTVDDVAGLADAIAAAQVRAAREFQPRGDPAPGGPSLIDATPLEPGTYQDTILNGESLWYSMQAQRGQSLTARLTVRTSGIPAEASISLEWQDGNARPVAAQRLSPIPPGQAATLAVSTGEADGSRTALGGTRDPGAYYLVARVAGFPPDVEHDLVLETGITGEALGEPTTSAAAATQVPAGSQADSQGSPQPSSAAASAAALPPPPSGGSTGAVVVLVLVLVAGGALAAFLRWRSLRNRQRPEAPTYL